MRISKVLILFTVVVLATSMSMADATLCTEDPGTGCVIQLPVGGTTIYVASDGETPFDPWGSGLNTSDGIALDSVWQFDSGAGWVACPGCTNPPFAGANIWVLPEGGPEAIGYWDAPGNSWSVSSFTYTILEPDGSISDTITIGNFGPGGDAAIAFRSGVPEPGSMFLLGSGLLGLAGMLKRKK